MSRRTSRWVLRIMVLLFFSPSIAGFVLTALALLDTLLNPGSRAMGYPRTDPNQYLLPTLAWTAVMGTLFYFFWKNRRPPRRRAKTARRKSR